MITQKSKATQPKKVYKIRDKETGLYSTGGHNPKWTKSGKAWSGTGMLMNHLTGFIDSSDWDWGIRARKKKVIPDSWEVVEFEIVQEEGGVMPAKKWYEGRKTSSK